MFASPVIYPTSAVPDHLKLIYILNPMAPVIDNFRRVTVFNLPPKWDELFLSFVISISLFFLAYYFFKKKEKIFADVI
jgi:lipopolysaccharide transport system permease protein